MARGATRLTSPPTSSVGEHVHCGDLLDHRAGHPGGFQFELDYNAVLNDCVDSAGHGPASTATRTPTSAPPCSAAPSADRQRPGHRLGLQPRRHRSADLLQPRAATRSCKCNTVTGTTELPFGWDVSEPIAVVTFKALTAGVDNLTAEERRSRRPRHQRVRQLLPVGHQLLRGRHGQQGHAAAGNATTPDADRDLHPLPPTATPACRCEDGEEPGAGQPVAHEGRLRRSRRRARAVW